MGTTAHQRRVLPARRLPAQARRPILHWSAMRDASSILGARLIDRPLDVLIASGTFHPDSGGPPTYLRTLGRELVERGHHIRVVTYGDAPARHRYPYSVRRIPRGLSVPKRLGLFVREIVRHGRQAALLYVNDYGLPAM